MFSASDGYERFMGRWSRELAPRLVAFAGISDGDTVLDVGCGTGALSRAVSAITGVRAVGVDPSSEFVRTAATLATHRSRFTVGRADALTFADAQFDRTLSLLVLNFVPDPDSAMREMIRVTRPGGVIAAAVWDYADGMHMLREFWDAAVALDPVAASHDEGRMPLCRRSELLGLWNVHGLCNVEERPLSIDMRYSSFDDYWEPFLCGQGPAGAYAVSLPAPGRAALRQRLRLRLDSNGPFTLPRPRVGSPGCRAVRISSRVRWLRRRRCRQLRRATLLDHPAPCWRHPERSCRRAWHCTPCVPRQATPAD